MLEGYHHREGGVDSGEAKLISKGRTDGDKVYTGSWNQDGPYEDKYSTFFPDGYSKDDVRGAIREAFDNRSATEKPDQWVGTTSRGLTIRGYVSKGTSLDDATEDDITTAHPIRKKK